MSNRLTAGRSTGEKGCHSSNAKGKRETTALITAMRKISRDDTKRPTRIMAAMLPIRAVGNRPETRSGSGSMIMNIVAMNR